jgi:hypothetical protein
MADMEVEPQAPAQVGFSEDQLKMMVALSEALGGHPRNHLAHPQSSFGSETEFYDALRLAFNSPDVTNKIDNWFAKRANTKLEMTVSMKNGYGRDGKRLACKAGGKDGHLEVIRLVLRPVPYAMMFKGQMVKPPWIILTCVPYNDARVNKPGYEVGWVVSYDDDRPY